MAEFADLTPYAYSQQHFIAGTINVGWLGTELGFNRGEVGPEFLDALWKFCRLSVVRTRGGHFCEFCDDKVLALCGKRGDEELMLGTSEIRVFAEDATFAAPTLIYHYVERHQYLPPERFRKAVMSGPYPDEEAYLRILQAQGLEYDRTGKFYHPSKH